MRRGRRGRAGQGRAGQGQKSEGGRGEEQDPSDQKQEATREATERRGRAGVVPHHHRINI